MEGVGIVRLGELAVARALENRWLEPLLLDVQVSEGYPLWAVLPPGRQRSPKVKVFLEFLTTIRWFGAVAHDETIETGMKTMPRL